VTPPDVRDELVRVTALVDLGRAGEARARLTALLAAEPGNAAALRLLARCHNILGDHAEAVRVAQAAVAADPASEHSQRILASALNAAGNHWAATAAAREAVRLAPNVWMCHWLLADCLRHSDPRAALDCVVQARNLAPDEADVHVLYGVVVKQLGRTEEARLAYLHALSINPNQATAHNNLAVLDRLERKWMRALAGFRTSLRHNPQQKLARDNLTATIVVLLRRFCAATYLCAVGVLLAAAAAGGMTLRLIGVATLATLLVLLGVLLLMTRRSVGQFAGTVLRTDRRAVRTLIATAVPLAFIAAGAVAQVIPLHRIDSAIGHSRVQGSSLVPVVGLGLIAASRSRAGRRRGK
jgi:Flp pilus assembly protein TadD